METFLFLPDGYREETNKVKQENKDESQFIGLDGGCCQSEKGCKCLMGSED